MDCWSQLVSVPCKGSASECAQKFNQRCDTAEPAVANLIVPHGTKIWGVLIDPTGAVFAHPEPGLTVELRDPRTSKALASSKVSDMGTFDVGKVASGAYRLIVTLHVNGNTKRFPGWSQPEELACGDGNECTLAMLLRPTGTDNPIDFCPPK
jgi:hypothetical protein